MLISTENIFPSLPFSLLSTSLLMLVTIINNFAGASQSKFSTVEETIDCYECKSTIHKHCRDPFNSTSALFAIEPCKGCCVKIVRHHNTTEEESIWRTCTAKLEMSNSLIHSDVCMGESNGQGHLCICSEDKCNSAARLHLFPFGALLSLVICSSLLIQCLFHI